MLPRLGAWSGYAVWDERSPRGRYHVHERCTDVPTGRTHDDGCSYVYTGFSFDTLETLLTWLVENPPTAVERETRSTS